MQGHNHRNRPTTNIIQIRWSILHPLRLWCVLHRETGRNLATTIDEHKRAVLHLDPKNALAAHIMQNMDHSMQWQNSTIKDYDSNWYRRCVKESIWIRLTNNTINTDPGLSINKTWIAMLPNGSKTAMKECPNGPHKTKTFS